MLTSGRDLSPLFPQRAEKYRMLFTSINYRLMTVLERQVSTSSISRLSTVVRPYWIILWGEEKGFRNCDKIPRSGDLNREQRG